MNLEKIKSGMKIELRNGDRYLVTDCPDCNGIAFSQLKIGSNKISPHDYYGDWYHSKDYTLDIVVIYSEDGLEAVWRRGLAADTARVAIIRSEFVHEMTKDFSLEELKAAIANRKE